MWFYSLNDLQHGPVSVAGLKSLLAQQAITAQSLVWREGMAGWKPMDETELAAELSLPLPEGDAWQRCAFSGDRARRSEMVPLDGFWVAAAHKDEAVEYMHQGGRLPKVEQDSNLTGSIELGHLMRSSWAMLRDNLGTVVLICLLVGIPTNVLSALLGSNAVVSHPMTPLSLNVFIKAFLTPFSNGAILYLYGRHARGMQTGLGEALLAGVLNWPRLFVAHLITLVLTILGLLCLVFPGLLISIRVSLAEPAAVEGQMSGSSAVHASWDITEGQYWRTFGYLMLVSLLCGWPPVILNLFARQFPLLQHWLVMGVLVTLLRLPSIYVLTFAFNYYKELQARQRMGTRYTA